MFSGYRGFALLILWGALFVIWGCSETNRAAPAVNIVTSTKTLSTVSIETANFLETASMKDIIFTDIPTVSATITPAPPGTYALFFYSPLVMNYDPLIWEIKNGLRIKKLTSCFIGEQGPTDFNGTHSEQIVRLGEINYTVLSFPESSPEYISHVYLADPSLATETGLPVFWVGAKSDEWNECKKLAEDVLSTLHSPLH